jgi:superfamily I DNA and/or RNA helicase
MTQDYRSIQRMESNTEGSRHLLVKLATHLLHRTEGLKQTLRKSEAVSSKIGKLALALDDDSDFSFDAILSLVGSLLQDFSTLPSRALSKELVDSADIIFCTLSTAGNSVVGGSREIDGLVVDEAAAATEPENYIPFRLKPKKLLIVGDPKQLPPTVFSRRAKMLGLGLSLQERMMNGCGHKYTMLNTQYRMHPAISAFPSRKFYNGLIANGSNTKEVRSSSWLDGRPYTFLQVNGTEEPPPNKRGGLRNPQEAAVVVDLVQQLVGLRGQRDESWNSSDRIRIITFYQDQVSLIKKEMAEKGLNGVLVATVDSSQGCEADVVILSFVRSNGGSAGFLRDDRRMNVAMTRARHQLVCIGNMQYMSGLMDAPTLRRLCADAKSRKVAVPYQSHMLQQQLQTP